MYPQENEHVRVLTGYGSEGSFSGRVAVCTTSTVYVLPDEPAVQQYLGHGLYGVRITSWHLVARSILD